MTDQFGRDINYLRLSITDRCNLRCRYCMPDGCDMVEHGDILSYEEFLRLTRLFATLGVEHVRVTGGERWCASAPPGSWPSSSVFPELRRCR